MKADNNWRHWVASCSKQAAREFLNCRGVWLIYENFYDLHRYTVYLHSKYE